MREYRDQKLVIMKKSVLFIIAFVFTGFFCQAQLTEKIIKVVEKEARVLCEKFKCEYVGNVVVSHNSLRDDLALLVDGTVDYIGPECGNVTSDYYCVIKVVNISMEATCFYMIMPTCVKGKRIISTKRYSIGSDECR